MISGCVNVALAVGAFLTVLLGIAKPALANLPEVGQEVRHAIDVRLFRKIPLPPGTWRVEAAFEEALPLDITTNTGMTRIAEHTLVLSNIDRNASIMLT